MTRLISSAAVAALAVLTASCAPVDDMGGPGESAGARPERQCFSPEQVRNFRQGRTGQLYLRANHDDVYELNTAGGCTDLDFAQQLAITADGGLAGSRICTGDWARITVPGSTSRLSTCRARVDRVLTADQVAALPSAQRP